MGLVVVAQPQNVVSVGLHPPIGPCNDSSVRKSGYKKTDIRKKSAIISD
jgi:hypothetical protein